MAAGGEIPESAGFVPFDRHQIEQSIASRFERIVSTAPRRVAVTCREATLSYADLNGAANHIASVILDALGPRPQPVALLLGQGAAVITAILGVLKSGHFYVPLDPSYPQAALSWLLADSGARVMVTDTAHVALARRLLPEGDPIVAGQPPASACDNPAAPHGSPDALAYIYYTSGSTGTPKGVVDTHRNVLHNVMRYTNGLKISSSDRLSLVQSASFSGVVSTLFGALLNGATVLPYDISAEGVARIGPWLLDRQITMYHSVPAIFRHFLRAVDTGQQFPDMRVVRLEGDRASPSDLALYKAHFGANTVLAHGLGATECGLVRRLVVEPDSAIDGPLVPIGYPIEDMTVRLLDDEGRDVKTGETGEIAVESRFLSPGYWRRSDLTAKAFAAGREPGTRLYRTGDVGRLHVDGCLDHLGRKDFQPKVRGHRVDVEAIEAALIESHLVKEAVAVVRETSSGDGSLVAYVVPPVDQQVSVTALRRFVRRALPPHMMPHRFVVLTSLPLTASEKLDRRALPDPGHARPEIDTPFIAPRSALEVAIAGQWAAALGLEQVGVRDDFFELGGDSLDSVAILNRVSKLLGAGLPHELVFRAPTVEGMACAIEACRSDGSSRSAPMTPSISPRRRS